MDDVKIGEILQPGSEEKQKEQAERVRARFWQTLKRGARHIPFIEDLVAAYYCAMDPKTPLRVRGVLLAALAYFVKPVDFIPDFLVLFGFTDDVAVIGAAIAAIRGHMTEAHYAAARQALADRDLD
jgi:uncharacterized membrane protein YkvA (DUF1232 family)